MAGGSRRRFARRREGGRRLVQVEGVLVDGDAGCWTRLAACGGVAFGVDDVGVRPVWGDAEGEHLVKVGVGEALGFSALYLVAATACGVSSSV